MSKTVANPPPLNASKENCRKALGLVIDHHPRGNGAAFLRAFLESALKKLPTELSFAKDKASRKQRRKGLELSTSR